MQRTLPGLVNTDWTGATWVRVRAPSAERKGRIRRGWCGKHYRLWQIYGDPLYVRPKLSPEMKRCNACGEIKPETDFATKPYGDGKRTRASRCKECLRVERAQDRRENGDRVNENARRGYALNPSKKRASKAAYRERNRERLLVRQREKYRILYAEKPETWHAAKSRRKHRMQVEMDSLDRALSHGYRVAIRNDPCGYCGARVPGDMHVDHFFPLAKGGTDHWWNLMQACGPCNRRKHAYCGTRFLLTRRPDAAAA